MRHWIALLRAACPLALTTPALLAADKPDLDRVTPVPANEPVPVIDFFRPPLFMEPKLNSAGTYFAALGNAGSDQTALLICDLAKMQLTMTNGSRNKDVDSVAWLDETHVLTSLISDKLYAEGLYVTDATQATSPYPIETFSASSLVGVPADAPLKPLVWIYHNAYDDGKDLGVVQLDATKRLGQYRDAPLNSIQGRANRDESTLYGTRASIVRTFPAPDGGGVVIDYLADKDGRLAFAITVEQGVYSLFRFENKRWQKCPVDLDQVYPVAVGDVPNELIVAGPRQDGKPRALQRLDAATGTLGEVLLQDKAYDISDCTVYRHPVTRTVIGVRYGRSLYQSVWFDGDHASVQKLLTERYPGQVVKILGSDQAANRFFIAVYSDRQPAVYYMLDLKSMTLGLIKNSAPWIDPARMQPTNLLKIKTRDGQQFDAYLTLPAGASKANPAPLVVLPHGGPWARDNWGYDGEVQFLASRGYAVLQPNYRGSTGTTWRFPEEDQWAFRKMHDDVTDAVKVLVKTGLVDPARLAIMGTSFGGYLALCGAAFEPDLYRCAITISGVFDWEQMLKEKKYQQYDNAAYGIFARNLGNPKTNRDQFDQISPLRHIEGVKIPVFVAHGKEDEIAEVTESRALIAQLKKHHVPFDSMLVSGEGHGMSQAKNQVELYSRIEAFLAKNLMPKK